MQSIAVKLSWEIVALNDRGDGSEKQYTALEIAYGVALAHDEKGVFLATMRQIYEQVSDKELAGMLRQAAARGAKP